MDETKDSFTVGTAATGGAFKVYFDVGKDSREEIQQKIDLAVELTQKTSIIASQFKAKLKG